VRRLFASFLERVRRRYHPLHHLRHFPPIRLVRARIDRPWLTRIEGVPHPVAVRLGRNLGTVLSLGRAEEREIRDVLICLARANNSRTFWDIGANYGLFTFSLRAGLPELRIETFEPDPDYVALLHQTLGQSGAQQVRVHPLAISDTSGLVTFKRDLLSGSTGFLVGSRQPLAGAPDLAGTAGFIEVLASTIDAETDRLGVPDLIKIDVEGAELNVLQGGKGTLKEHMPIIVLECTEQHEDVRRFLEELGYEIRDAEAPANRITGSGMPFMAIALAPGRHQTCGTPEGYQRLESSGTVPSASTYGNDDQLVSERPKNPVRDPPSSLRE
jgi:FkbM family methyltransferase